MFDLKTFTKAALAGAVFAAAPLAANASVVQMTTDNAVAYSLDDVSTVYRWDTEDEFALNDTSGQDYFFKFSSTNTPRGVHGAITVNISGDFTNLQFAWSADDTLDAGDTMLTVANSIPLSFSIPASPYYLLTSYDARKNGGNIDYRISAVPLPAAGLLLLGAVGGLGLMRRRKTA